MGLTIPPVFEFPICTPFPPLHAAWLTWLPSFSLGHRGPRPGESLPGLRPMCWPDRLPCVFRLTLTSLQTHFNFAIRKCQQENSAPRRDAGLPERLMGTLISWGRGLQRSGCHRGRRYIHLTHIYHVPLMCPVLSQPWEDSGDN